MIEIVATFLLKSTLLLGLAGAYSRWESRSPAERHAVALIAILALPVMAVGGLLVRWNVALPKAVPDVLGWASATVAPAETATPLTWLIIVYLLGLAALMTSTVAELWTTSRHARLLAPYRGSRVAGACDKIQMRVDRCSSPWVYGARRPIIVVPEDFRSWAASRRRDALAHEIAHIRRSDWLSDALTRFKCNLFWFQPLSWAVRRRMQTLAERACDDIVLRRGADRYEYAETLLDIARHRRRESFKLPGSQHPLTDRIESILNRNAVREPMNANKFATTATLVLLLTCPIACVSLQAPDQPQQDEFRVLPTVTVAPAYPEEAAQQGIEGAVLLEFDITKDGATENIRIVSEEPPNMFADAAMQSAAQWVYPPLEERLQGVRSIIRFEMGNGDGSVPEGDQAQ